MQKFKKYLSLYHSYNPQHMFSWNKKEKKKTYGISDGLEIDRSYKCVNP